MSLTVREAADEIAEAANICATDLTRVCFYANKAVRRLLPKGKWKGTYQKYHLCTNQGCFTWPRQIETIESIALCGTPGTIRNEWYEFNEQGPGLFDGRHNNVDSIGAGCGGRCHGNTLVDRGLACTFADLIGTEKQLRVYTDFPADDGKTITFRGYDDQRNLIRTNFGNTEGETVTLAAGFVDTVYLGFWGVITQVIKDVTVGPVRVYEYNTVDATQRLIAMYESDETLPSYRRSYFPAAQITDDGSGACNKRSVDVMAKLKFIPVSKWDDFIMIGNLAAICEEIRAVRKFENNLVQEGLIYEQLALKYLNEELQNYLGDGTRVTLQIDGASPFDSGGIMNYI